MILESQFKNFEDLTLYTNHPEHLTVVNYIKTVVEQRVAIDYEA